MIDPRPKLSHHVYASVGFSVPCSTSWSCCSLAFTELRYVSGETRKGSGPFRETEKTERKRTPEQTDDTDEHEPEVWRNDGKVDDLCGYVYGPGFTREEK